MQEKILERLDQIEEKQNRILDTLQMLNLENLSKERRKIINDIEQIGLTDNKHIQIIKNQIDYYYSKGLRSERSIERCCRLIMKSFSNIKSTAIKESIIPKIPKEFGLEKIMYAELQGK